MAPQQELRHRTSPTVNKPRKKKPRISELEPDAAQRRRAQCVQAQRTYRQRRKDEIESLSGQVDDLSGTIERLNDCFLGLTDKLLSFGLIQSRLEMASVIHASVKQFIAANKIAEKPGGKTRRDGVNDETELPLRELTSERTDPSLVREVTNSVMTTSEQQLPSSIIMSLYSNLQSDKKAELSGPSTSGAYSNSLQSSVSDNQKYSRPGLKAPTLALSIPERVRSPIVDTGFATFARRLYLGSLHNAYRISLQSNPNDTDYRRMFHSLPDGTTQDQLKGFFSRAMTKLSNQPGPLDLENNVYKMTLFNSSGQHVLSPTAVALFFAKEGFDYDHASDTLVQYPKAAATAHSESSAVWSSGSMDGNTSLVPAGGNIVRISASMIIQNLAGKGQCLSVSPAYTKESVIISLLNAMA
ncbi:Hypothetical protein D9617_8g048920 [Elsinoe fawcettii]|nr:Hypothetical protein D9617_8g048920 [Elsinoe fawcettii]